MLYPLIFEQNRFDLVWGNEDWVISAVPNKESVVTGGALKGSTLSEVTARYGYRLLGKAVAEKYGDTFPLLVKFIDAKDDLSIQVHPNDELALARHGCLGKTEMWFVMDAEEGAHLYSGFSQPISKYEYAKRIDDGTICEVLQRHEVKRGDVFFIPAGRVHAICGGIRLAEIQQSCDITYRIFDYNRPGLDGKPRPLHTEEAADALDFRVYPTYKTDYLEKINKPVAITQSPHFSVKIHNITRPFHRKLYKYDSFVIYTCLHGNCMIQTRTSDKFWLNPTAGKDSSRSYTVRLNEGQSCLIPASIADVDLMPNNDAGLTELLEVYIDNKNYQNEK
ncbi:MAG: mannose-6-phosphate isomerase [Bacteroidaceae bacterium]|nr:mannose-6-phosphate isomerase [Bacteroidaceae bacterium]